MNATDIANLFEAYAQPFLTLPDGSPDEMCVLKMRHTQRVAENARLIVEGEDFPIEWRQPALIAAWLHDIGRFEQLKRYKTFSDRHSVNHALCSCAIILEQRILDGADVTPQQRNTILRAVECHNLKLLPEGLPPEEELLSHLVRDADKLDIFTVLDIALQTPDYFLQHPEMYWHLTYRGAPTPEIVDAIYAGEAVDYAQLNSLCDFVLIQIGWFTKGLHFSTSYQLAAERDEITIRETFLCDLVSPEHSATIRKCCDVARAAIQQRTAKDATKPSGV